VRDIGMPVFRDTRRFALVTPNARFHENEIPGPNFIAPPQVTINIAEPCSHSRPDSDQNPTEDWRGVDVGD